MGKGKILEVINLGVAFQTRNGVVQAAKDVGFEIHAGRTLGLVGESGSGKSVTALSLMRLLPQNNCRTEGRILLHDPASDAALALHELPEKAMQGVRGRRMGMVFQEPMSSLNPVFRCGEQVAESIRLHLRKSEKEAEGLTLQWFELVKLQDPARIYNAYPHQLSGGQKQRVMIAMALCCNPALLIADEPTTALDVTVQKAVLELIRELQQRSGAACLFISHDLGVISEIAHHVAVMHQGRIVEYGETEQILRSPRHPYTQGLIACRPPLERRLSRLPVISDFLKPTAPSSSDEASLRQGKADTPFPSHPTPRYSSLTPGEERSRLERLTSQQPVLEVNNLSVRYPGRPPVQAVSGAGFELYPGETLGLVGESGSGKTTLGRALLRLTDAQSGTAYFRGLDLLALTPGELRPLRRELQMIFQDPYASLNPRLRIGDAIAEPMRIHGISRNAAACKDQVVDLLETVGLSAAHYERYPRELSGGQRQRACVARALAVNPTLLICDESVSALDVSVQAQVLNLLQDLREARGLTMIFISHDLSVIRQISDRIIVMKDGRIVESGAAAEVCTQPKSAYTQQLLAAVPGRFFELR